MIAQLERTDMAMMSNIAKGNVYMPNLRNTVDEFKGTQFFIKDYCVGELLLTKNRRYTEGYQFKFDEMNNVVVAKDMGTGNEIEVNTAEVMGLKLSYKSKDYLFFRTILPDNLKGKERIVQLLFHTPNISFYKATQKKMFLVSVETHTNEEKVTEFKSFTQYYLKTDTDLYRPVKLTKSMLLEAFPTQKAKIEQLLSKPKYKKINEQTVVDIFTELETAQKK
jgi:hypothetical protein